MPRSLEAGLAREALAARKKETRGIARTMATLASRDICRYSHEKSKPRAPIQRGTSRVRRLSPMLHPGAGGGWEGGCPAGVD